MNKPSLKQLIDRAKATMVAKLGVDNPAIDAIAAAIGGGNYGNYAYQDFLFKQMHPETANEDFLYLWAERFNTPRISPVQASGFVQFETAGVVNLPAGIALQTTDGNKYTTTASGSSDGPIACVCDLPGVAGNLSAGVKLNMLTALPGVSPINITVVSMNGGADAEEVERWRGRIVTSFNEKYMVGRREDYAFWAQSAHPDVGFAYAQDNYPDLGKVTVYFGAKLRDISLDSATISTVQAYLDAKRLAGCHVYAVNASAKAVNITLSGISEVSTREAVEQALDAMFIAKLGSRDAVTPSEIMLAVTGVTSSFGLISPIAPVAPEQNEALVLGALAWQ